MQQIWGDGSKVTRLGVASRQLTAVMHANQRSGDDQRRDGGKGETRAYDKSDDRFDPARHFSRVVIFDIGNAPPDAFLKARRQRRRDAGAAQERTEFRVVGIGIV